MRWSVAGRKIVFLVQATDHLDTVAVTDQATVETFLALLAVVLAVVRGDVVVVEAPFGDHVRGRLEGQKGHDLRVHVEHLFLEELEDGVLLHRVTVDPKERRCRRQVVLALDQHVPLVIDDLHDGVGVAAQGLDHLDDRVDGLHLGEVAVVDVQFEVDSLHLLFLPVVWPLSHQEPHDGDYHPGTDIGDLANEESFGWSIPATLFTGKVYLDESGERGDVRSE